MSVQGMRHTDEAVHMQAEFPAIGTSLNPVEELWVFSHTQGTPGEELAEADQQGE